MDTVAQVCFGAGMAAQALSRELSGSCAWDAQKAGVRYLVDTTRARCTLPCMNGSDIVEVEINLRWFNRRWFPVTATVISASESRTYLFHNSCEDGSIVGLHVIEPRDDDAKFDLDAAMLCPHPESCVD